MLNKIRDHLTHTAHIIRDWLSKQLMAKKTSTNFGKYIMGISRTGR